MWEQLYITLIRYWQINLGLEHYKIRAEAISRAQVTFPEDIEEEDKYFIGVSIEGNVATINYDRRMTEEDILHELLHLANPGKDDKEGEDWINAETTKLLKQKNELNKITKIV